MVMENERKPAGATPAKQAGPNQPGQSKPESEPGAGRLKDQTAGIEDTGQSAGISREGMRRAGEEAKHAASKMRDEVKQRSADLVDRAQQGVGNLVGQGKERAAEQIDSVAEALRSAARKLHEDENDAVADYAETAADQIERLTGYLHGRDPGVMVRDLENFARRRPEVFIGGAVLAGLIAGRFLKSSGDRDWDRRERRGGMSRFDDNTRPDAQRFGESYDTGRLPEPTGVTSGIASAATTGASALPSGQSTTGQTGMGQTGIGQSGTNKPGASPQPRSPFGGASGQGGATSGQGGGL